MVIVTSRHQDSEALADKENRIELKGLDETEAIQLLLLESEIDNPEGIPIQHATKIVHRLAYHPLAIAQAGAYIRMRSLNFQDFLEVYNEQQAAILRDTTPLMSDYWKRVNHSTQEIPISLVTTCELSYQQLLDLENTEHRNLPGLLTLLAFFDSRDISEGHFEAYCRSQAQSSSRAEPYQSAEIEAPAGQIRSMAALAVPSKNHGQFLGDCREGWDELISMRLFLC